MTPTMVTGPGSFDLLVWGDTLRRRVVGGLALAATLVVLPSCAEKGPPPATRAPANVDAGSTSFFPTVDASVVTPRDAGFVTDDAGAVQVHLGLVPVAFHPELDAGEPDLSESDQLAADVQLVASGARSAVVEVAWDELMPDGDSVDSAVLSSLARRTRFFSGSGVRVTLALGTVVGAHDRRPPPLRGRWTAPEVARGFRKLVDELMVGVIPHVRRLSVATLLDRWMVANDADTVRRASDFLLSAITEVRDHEERPALFDVGVEVTLAAARSPSAALVRVLSGVDVRFVTYLPGVEDGSVEDAASSAASLLEGMLELSSPGSVPVVLHRFAYPSSAALGSSEQAQSEFYERIVEGVVARPGAFSVLNAWGLNDMAQGDCEERAAEFGQPIGASRVELLCSVGLQDRDGRPKRAWNDFLEASARFFAQ